MSIEKLRLFLLAIVFGLTFTGQAQAIIIGFDPAVENVAFGDSVDVDLVISGLGDFATPSLGAFALDVTFDPAILDLTTVVFGTGLDSFGFGTNPRGYSEAGGILNIFEVSLDSAFDLNVLQPGSFSLATLTFDAIGTGTSSLGINNVILSDSIGSTLSADVEMGSITAVPEPATLALLSLGLAGLGFTRRRMKA